MQQTTQVVNLPATPLSLIAELTHRCPLHCLYCSNPVEMRQAQEELSTAEWTRTFQQAAEMGVLHLHLTGGEPLVRTDLRELIAAGRAAGLYVNMITSGVGLTEQRLETLVGAGLEHLQLSFQDLERDSANFVAGASVHTIKMALVPILKRSDLAFTVNLVVHRLNLDRLEEFLAWAEELEPHRLEIAHVQYYGWALRNRALLMPTEDQVRRALPLVEAARDRLRGKIHLEAVFPDYFGSSPKACVGGWGRQMMLVDPSGAVLPCHAAATIPGLVFDNVRERKLASIWRDSKAFLRFRGDAWMSKTCRECPGKERDFGGCRCQAFSMTGNPDAIDPVCSYSPDHGKLLALRTSSPQSLPIYRQVSGR